MPINLAPLPAATTGQSSFLQNLMQAAAQYGPMRQQYQQAQLGLQQQQAQINEARVQTELNQAKLLNDRLAQFRQLATSNAAVAASPEYVAEAKDIYRQLHLPAPTKVVNGQEVVDLNAINADVFEQMFRDPSFREQWVSFPTKEQAIAFRNSFKAANPNIPISDAYMNMPNVPKVTGNEAYMAANAMTTIQEKAMEKGYDPVETRNLLRGMAPLYDQFFGQGMAERNILPNVREALSKELIAKLDSLKLSAKEKQTRIAYIQTEIARAPDVDALVQARTRLVNAEAADKPELDAVHIQQMKASTNRLEAAAYTALHSSSRADLLAVAASARYHAQDLQKRYSGLLNRAASLDSQIALNATSSDPIVQHMVDDWKKKSQMYKQQAADIMSNVNRAWAAHSRAVDKIHGSMGGEVTNNDIQTALGHYQEAQAIGKGPDWIHGLQQKQPQMYEVLKSLGDI